MEKPCLIPLVAPGLISLTEAGERGIRYELGIGLREAGDSVPTSVSSDLVEPFKTMGIVLEELGVNG